MFTLIIGGSGSGKSEYAENTAVKLSRESGLPLYYIAAMQPFGAEGEKRVERHRRLRAGKGFITIERYVNLKELSLPEKGVVLLECISNLAANEMFEEKGAGGQTVEEVLLGVHELRKKARHLAAVTNDIFSDGMIYDKTTEQYQRYLGAINRELAAEADRVVEVVCGIPLCIKGGRENLPEAHQRRRCHSVREAGEKP